MNYPELREYLLAVTLVSLFVLPLAITLQSFVGRVSHIVSSKTLELVDMISMRVIAIATLSFWVFGIAALFCHLSVSWSA